MSKAFVAQYGSIAASDSQDSWELPDQGRSTTCEGKDLGCSVAASESCKSFKRTIIIFLVLISVACLGAVGYSKVPYIKDSIDPAFTYLSKRTSVRGDIGDNNIIVVVDNSVVSDGSPTPLPTLRPTGGPPTLSPALAPTPVPTAIPTIEGPTSVVVDVVDTSGLLYTMKRTGYNALNFFSPDASTLYKYDFLLDYKGVIEPYSDMELNLYSTLDSDAYYSYTICPVNVADATNSECYEGIHSTSTTISSTSVNVECSPYDEYSIEVSEVSYSTKEVQKTSFGYLLCMYVRREIRELTDDDRDRLMDAMHEMWATDELKGQTTYGEDYHSSTYLLEFHFFNAAWQDGDHIHEGNGFLPQHIKMTNIFETSIQSVDKSVALPFWDFTIENAQNISIMLSPIFNAEFFGSMPRSINQYWGWTYRNDSLAAGAIQDGRWAFIKADKNDKYDELQYGYGYLRAPWNMNPSPYLSRFTSSNKHLPSCASHYTLLGYTDITDFLFESPYAAHAGTHGVIGGVYGCDAMDDMLANGYLMDEDGQISLCKNWIFYLKEFYRLDYIMPDSNCTYSEDGHDISLSCGYSCNEELTADFVFELKNILNSDNDCVPYDLQDKGWFAWKDFICEGDGYKIFGGDHLEAASPADPSFWPIHPTLERLLQAKYMAGGFENEEWPTDATNDYVCDKSYCFDGDDWGYWDDCCYGHYYDDQMMDAQANDRDQGYGPTNREIHEWTNPSSSDYAMPYIYSDFDWSHCSMVGLDFEDLLTESSSTSNSLSKPKTDDVMELKKTNSQLSALVIGKTLAKSEKKSSTGRGSSGKSSSSSPMQLRGMSPTDITSKVKASYKRRNRR